MKISSRNEWDTLEECVVGDATAARFPEYDGLFRKNEDATTWKETPHPFGNFPEEVIDEANEDLQILANTLTLLGVTVHRPDPVDFSKVITTNDWSTDGMYNYCPRDVLLVIDDLVIECPMAYRARQFENVAYTSIKRAAIKDGVRWISAPRPRLLDTENYVANGHFCLSEDEPIFDAANVCRVNNDILYLVSNSGNRLGGQWLQSVLGKDYKVHMLDNLYSHAHIDSTVTPLRDGLVLLNGSRVTETNCPEVFKGWDKIYVDDVVPANFHQYPYASKWIAINMLVVNPSTVVCDKNQPTLIKEIEKRGITVIPLELRHARTMGGGFHCVTLDLIRS